MLRALLRIRHILGDSFICLFIFRCLLCAEHSSRHCRYKQKAEKKNPCLLFDTLEQGLANFFRTEADNIDCQLCEPSVLCCNY